MSKPTMILAATADGRAVDELRPAMISEVREIASRESGGLTVVLCWHLREDAVTLAVSDSRNGERVQLPVASDRALEAFYHPFAYAAREERRASLRVPTHRTERTPSSCSASNPCEPSR